MPVSLLDQCIALHRSGRIIQRSLAPASTGGLTQEDDMFGPITLLFVAKMLFNTVTLKPGVTSMKWSWLSGECA